MMKYFMSRLIYFHEPEGSENKACYFIPPTYFHDVNFRYMALVRSPLFSDQTVISDKSSNPWFNQISCYNPLCTDLLKMIG